LFIYYNPKVTINASVKVILNGFIKGNKKAKCITHFAFDYH
ncbi:MAG: hypothetical protein ACI9A0_003329, partial [Pseudoalteromonas tetraodonis]